jgi:hypothetical protein
MGVMVVTSLDEVLMRLLPTITISIFPREDFKDVRPDVGVMSVEFGMVVASAVIIVACLVITN